MLKNYSRLFSREKEFNILLNTLPAVLVEVIVKFFPGPPAFCKKAVERVNSEKNILNGSVECVEWSGFFRESHMYAHHQMS